MTGDFDPKLMFAGVIGLAAIAAAWGTAGRERDRRWKIVSTLAQLVAALLFYLLLFPPSTALRLDSLVILAPGATQEQRASLSFGQTVIALPGVVAPARAERAPDLATALRRHPAATSLHVIGNGLPLRDLPAAEGYGLSLDAPPQQGLIELRAPTTAPVGTQWIVSGRVAGARRQVELHDPSGAIVDSVAVGKDGGFRVSALARAAGPLLFELRVLDAQSKTIDHASVPVLFRGGAALSTLVRAGAPDADLKYWRRWAADAGITVAVSIGLSDGVALHDGDAAFTPEPLSKADLVIVDERAWAALGAEEKFVLIAAVRQGLGLMLRIGGIPEAAVAADWAALGIELDNLDAPRSVTLDGQLGLVDRAPFTAAPVTLRDGVGTPFVHGDGGEVLASAFDLERGRIGVWTLRDSYRLALLGDSGRYGGLWSKAIASLARPRARASVPELPSSAWVDERVVLCDLAPQAEVTSPVGTSVPLLVSDNGCAAFWPSEAGWHARVSAGGRWPFFIRKTDDGAGLRASRDLQATQALTGAASSEGTQQQGSVPLPRWPFLIAWLILSGVIWWRERRLFANG